MEVTVSVKSETLNYHLILRGKASYLDRVIGISSQGWSDYDNASKSPNLVASGLILVLIV